MMTRRVPSTAIPTRLQSTISLLDKTSSNAEFIKKLQQLFNIYEKDGYTPLRNNYEFQNSLLASFSAVSSGVDTV